MMEAFKSRSVPNYSVIEHENALVSLGTVVAGKLREGRDPFLLASGKNNFHDLERRVVSAMVESKGVSATTGLVSFDCVQ